MPSDLKSRLNRLKSASASRTPPPPPPALIVREARFPADDALFSLDARALARIGLSEAFLPEKALFLDTETTGLSGGTGTVAFLAGLGRIEGRELIVRQYLMPSYAAEHQLMEAIAKEAALCDTVITFNGKSFDIPLLESRFVMCRMKSPFGAMRHLDLIHPARRTWKMRLKDCSLSNLEEKVLSLHRERDLSGSEVPARYFDFLKTGDFRLLEDVIDHNRQDIVSLSGLLVRLSGVYAAPAVQTNMLDVFSAGRALEKQGDADEARTCYRRAAQAVPLTDLSRLREARCTPLAKKSLSLMLRREGDIEGARELWLDMISHRQGGTFPFIELAKLSEHHDRDCRTALSYTRQALQCATDADERAELLHRAERLMRRIEKDTLNTSNTSQED